MARPKALAGITQAADRAAELGGPHLVVGGGAKRYDGTRPTDFDRLGAALDRVVDIASDRGLTAHYHPHLSTIVEGPEEARRIFGLTSIDFCPDRPHLAAAGGDPAEMIREHASRISYVHLKGLQRDPFAFTPPIGVMCRLMAPSAHCATPPLKGGTVPNWTRGRTRHKGHAPAWNILIRPDERPQKPGPTGT